MDFVYICRDGENEELRYSIRSVLANYPEATIWVIGGKPSWYTGNFINVPIRGSKYHNARRNLQVLVASPQIPEKFILMNDDFFIMKPVINLGYFNSGPLINKINKYYEVNPRSTYLGMLEKTYRGLKGLGFENPIDYELHVPMPMEKSKLAKVLQYPFLWRSTYGNLYNVGGRTRRDVKIYSSELISNRLERTDLKNSPFLSSEDNSFGILLDKIFRDKFPEKSPFEKY